MQIFKVARCSLQQRWDPHFHRPVFVEMARKLDKLGARSLGSYTRYIFSGITPLSGGDSYTGKDEGVAFIRSGDFNDDGTIDEPNLIYLKPEVHARLMERSQLAAHDVLFAIVGATIGKVGFFPGGYPANINQAVGAVRVSDEQFAKFLHVFFLSPLGQQQIDRIKRPVARANMNLAELGSLRVPPVSRTVQIAVVEKLKNGIAAQTRTEAQARQLLASIDDLLLSELGIQLPPEPPATLANRVFTRPFSELTGRRFDPSSHSRNLDLTGGKFPALPITKVARLNPRTDFSHLEASPISFVPMEAVSDDLGEAACSATRPAEAAKSYTPFQEGDVISAKITPCMENGKAAVLRGLVGGYGYGSTEYHVFRPDPTRLNAEYLHALLRLQTLRTHARLFFTGSAGHQRVSDEFFYRLQIPLPPLKTQQRIVEKIAARRDEAKRLRADAAAQLAAAKLEIEAMILG